ncbi:NF-kappa-B inhibitor cactus-like [Amphibalanus amphitrite]|uniref:NF-kappa-B inhibitor cactus-like n=1 Tax=Amphibalanus amphitrite TaxID=1232801 RepID=UPI001C9026AD|nr:NF-kappa-B inhibitor cactus-like [Amphibalanus amphitrite]
MSHRGRMVDSGEGPLPSAVSDCAPVTRGTAARPSRFFASAKQQPSDHNKSLLDSGLDSGFLSQGCLSEEGLSQRSLSSGPLEPAAPRCPKEAAATAGESRLDSGLDLADRLTGELSQLELAEKSELSESERELWQERYVTTLREAFQGDDDGDTHLHLAIIYGLRKVAIWLIRLVPHPSFLNLKNSYQQTPLHLAALTGDSELVRHLLVAGADPTLRDRHGNTPLHVACERGDRGCVLNLTEPVTANEMRQAACRYTCQPRPLACAQLDEWNYQGLSCLHLAVASRDREITAHLIIHGCNVNITEGKSGRTPLVLAIEMGDIEMLRFLVEAGKAEVNIPTYGGLSGYQLALLNGRRDVAELLLHLGAQVSPLPDSEMDLSSSDSESESLMKGDDVYSELRLRGQPLVAAQ